MYKIYVRDQYLNRVAEIDDYTSLEFIPRFNAVGSWVLDLPTDSKAAKRITEDKAGIIVVKDGQTLFSGPVRTRNRKWNSNQDTITVSGYDDNVSLMQLAYSVPSGNFSLQDYDVRTGKAETIMKQYVDVNIGTSALPQRKLLALEVDKGLGNMVTGRARFHTLLEILQKLALSGGGLGFRVVQVNKTLEFQVYQPTDKTKSVFFSPLLGNLADFEYTHEHPETNYVIVGGGGEGKNRILLERGDSGSITKYGRYETFIDRRDTTDLNELYQAMDEELAEKAHKASLSITPIDLPNLSFGKQYNLGDKVSVVLTQPTEKVTVETLHFFISAYQTVPVQSERIRKVQEKFEVIQDIVREVKITITADGAKISPVVGTPGATNSGYLGFFSKMKSMAKQISNLERR